MINPKNNKNHVFRPVPFRTALCAGFGHKFRKGPCPLSNFSSHRGVGYVCTIVLAIIIILLGLPLLIGGVDLAMLGGSLYYVIVGVLLVIAGALMVMDKSSGALLFLLAWVGTLVWALWEVGLDGWALLPRVFGPTLIAIAVLLVLPGMRRRATPISARSV